MWNYHWFFAFSPKNKIWIYPFNKTQIKPGWLHTPYEQTWRIYPPLSSCPLSTSWGGFVDSWVWGGWKVPWHMWPGTWVANTTGWYDCQALQGKKNIEPGDTAILIERAIASLDTFISLFIWSMLKNFSVINTYTSHLCYILQTPSQR